MEKELYELYIELGNMDNIKHEKRIAPDRDYSHKTFMKLKQTADSYGLSMTICNWGRNELGITERGIPLTIRPHRITVVEGCKI